MADTIPIKKKKQLNIGLVIFGIIFIYLIATVVMYITAPHITVYEVRQGSILKDNAYTGLAIRDEVVVKANDDGYINYYVQDSSKVKVGSYIYTLSDEKLNFETSTSEEDLKLSSEEEQVLLLKIQKYNQDFDSTNFSDTYYLKEDIENTLSNLSSQSKSTQLSNMVSQNPDGIELFTTAEDGIVVHSVDGLEGLSLETATLEHLKKSDYHKVQFSNNTKIHTGDTVYKVITDDEWYVMIELSEETATVLEDKPYVKVNFTKDNQSMWANFQIKEIDDHYIGYLTFQDSMVRYASERYLDIELILEDESGLKIPKTAETSKEFYVVPKAYITQGGNSSNNGVLKQTKDEKGNQITQFVPVDIYYEDEEVVYLDPNQFDKNDVLLMPESNDTFQLSEKGTLKGVYCINKGYAVFKQIQILCESDTYYIIEEGNKYGLSNYDHIAMDSTNIKENDVVF